MKLNLRKILLAFAITAYLLSGVSANIQPPKPSLRAPTKTDAAVTFVTTVEVLWEGLPWEDYAVLFYTEAAGPQCGTLECGWHGVAGPLNGEFQYVFRWTHESEQGVFKVWKYNYPDPLDPEQNPPAEWFTPVQITGIRFVSRLPQNN